jgi:hypothetical protein
VVIDQVLRSSGGIGRTPPDLLIGDVGRYPLTLLFSTHVRSAGLAYKSSGRALLDRSRTVPSQPPEAMQRPSGQNTTLPTRPVWPGDLPSAPHYSAVSVGTLPN